MVGQVLTEKVTRVQTSRRRWSLVGTWGRLTQAKGTASAKAVGREDAGELVIGQRSLEESELLRVRPETYREGIVRPYFYPE